MSNEHYLCVSVIASNEYTAKLLPGFRVFANKDPTICFKCVLPGLTIVFWVFIILLGAYIMCIEYYIQSFLIAYHCYISIHLIHAKYGRFFDIFSSFSYVFGQYQPSLSLEIDNWCTGDHICRLGHLLPPNIAGVTVDLVPKSHVVWSFGWHQVCSFLFIESRKFHMKFPDSISSFIYQKVVEIIDKFIYLSYNFNSPKGARNNTTLLHIIV